MKLLITAICFTSYLAVTYAQDSGRGSVERRCVEAAVVFAPVGDISLEVPRPEKVRSMDLVGRGAAGKDFFGQIDLPGHPGVGTFRDVVPAWNDRLFAFAGSIDQATPAVLWTLITSYPEPRDSGSCLASTSIDVPAHGESVDHALLVPKASSLADLAVYTRAIDGTGEVACVEQPRSRTDHRSYSCASAGLRMSADVTPYSVDGAPPPSPRVSPITKILGHGYRVRCISEESGPTACRLEFKTSAYPPQRGR